MSVLSIRINEKKRKLLKIISALEEKTIGGLIESWIDEHIEKIRVTMPPSWMKIYWGS